MARKKKAILRSNEEVVLDAEVQLDEMSDLRFYVAEAEKIELMQMTQGWQILERDLSQYKSQISSKLAYISPKLPEFEESRILFIAADKILSIVNDYAENRKRAIELLKKIDNPQDNIILDMDNQ